jgi:hypothetical protein
MRPFFLHFCQVQKVFYDQEFNHYLQIKHQKKLYYNKRDFTTILVFLGFVTIFEK